MPNNIPDHPDVPIPADHTGNNNAPNGTEVPCYRGETSRENAPTHISIAAQPQPSSNVQHPTSNICGQSPAPLPRPSAPGPRPSDPPAADPLTFTVNLISAFTAADFETQTLPYVMLRADLTDEDRDRIVTALTDRAAALGVKLTRREILARAGREGRTKKPDANDDGVTHFSDFGREFRCDGYICTDAGVFKKTAGARENALVCPHAIFPVGRETNLNTNVESIVLLYDRGEGLESHTAPRSVIASQTKILSLGDAGIAVHAANARLLSEFLIAMDALNGDRSVRTESASALGWYMGHTRFLPCRLTETEYRVHADPDEDMARRFDAIRGQGDPEAWVRTVGAARLKSLPLRLALAASFASPLLSPLGQQPFLVHFWGRTGVGKTVALQAAASVWADPAPGKYLCSFNATAVGLELNAAFLRHLPLCVDELMVRTADGEREFSHLIYTLCEGTGRTRGKKDGGLRRQSDWALTVISTGERPITGGTAFGGAVNRVIEVEMETPLCEDFAALISCIGANCGWAGETYLKEIVARGFPRVREQTVKWARAFRDLGVTGKQAAAAAALLMADTLASKFVFGDTDHLLQPGDLLPYLKKEADLDPEADVLEAVFASLAGNPGKIKGFDGSDYEKETWGKLMPKEPLDGDKQYVAIIGAVFDKLVRDAGGDPTAVLRYANRKGLVKRGINKAIRKNIRIGTIQTKCVVMQMPDADS